MAKLQNPDRNPSIEKVRAVVTTRWGKAYSPKVIRSIESYNVDTALDSDADVWTMDFGDPNGNFMDLLQRDAEIRVQLFGVGTEGVNPLVTGIADEASYQDGSWTLTGRDFSALAMDSFPLPLKLNHVRAWSVIDKQAKELKFPRTNLAKGTPQKTQQTDGSETYWEFWYRLYRRDKMWIWCEPDGTLTAGPLSYTTAPVYYFGDEHDGDSLAVRRATNPVESFSMRKTTQNRVYEVIVYGHNGDTGFSTTAQHDTTMSAWTKKPRKFLLDTESHSVAGARKMAWDEIFEGKVGSLEFSMTISDPGFPIRQNNIARVYLKDIGLFGNFYIVGVRTQANQGGFVQEIRLRERQFAISRRVPADPKVKTQNPRDPLFSAGLGHQIEQQAGMPTGWGDYFVKAANKWNGTANFRLFLATLLAIADKESAFINQRQGNGPGGFTGINWYPFKGNTAQTDHRHNEPGAAETRSEWEIKWANDQGGKYNCGPDVGVGVMQLTSQGLKEHADDLMKANFRNEFSGGRWHPEHNIMAAAEYLQSCWKGTNAQRDIDMWKAADAYNRGVGGANSYFDAHGRISPYGQDIKYKVLVDPKYAQMVDDAAAVVAQQQKEAKADAGPFTSATDTTMSPNGKYVMPLNTPVDFNKSEFLTPGVPPGPDGKSKDVPDGKGNYYHGAKDWFAHAGSYVFAPAAGKIVEVTRETNSADFHVFGGVVKLEMQNGHVWVFRHVNPVDGLKEGMRVKGGIVLAKVARWPAAPDRSHCHIEFWMHLTLGGVIGGYYLPNMRDPCKILTEK